MNLEALNKTEKVTKIGDYEELINSLEFKNWFGNSVVVDETGKPMNIVWDRIDCNQVNANTNTSK